MASCCIKFVVVNFLHASTEISNIMAINWSCMHTEYSCMRIEVISRVSIWMDYAVVASPVSCVESAKTFSYN